MLLEQLRRHFHDQVTVSRYSCIACLVTLIKEHTYSNCEENFHICVEKFSGQKLEVLLLSFNFADVCFIIVFTSLNASLLLSFIKRY